MTVGHLDLWDSVCKTDPKHTKQFSRAGGFKGTATNPTYLIRKATETFGPVGIGWGWHILDEDMLKGAPLGPDGAFELVHRVRIELWYKINGERGEIQHFGQTTFVGRTKNGLFTDEEAPKKSLTDAITKALSCLGFAADVHLGLYDDSKYVSDLKQEANDKPKRRAAPSEPVPEPTTSEPEPEPTQDQKYILESCNDWLRKAATPPELKKRRQHEDYKANLKQLTDSQFVRHRTFYAELMADLQAAAVYA